MTGTTEAHPTRDAVDCWASLPASALQVGSVAFDPLVGRWLFNPSGNSRVVRVEHFIDPDAQVQPIPDYEPGEIVFWYTDIDDPSYSTYASYHPEALLQVWVR